MVSLKIDRTDPLFPSLTKDMVDFFLKEKYEHISAVNEYAAKVGYIFPYHDADKFDDSESAIFIIWSWVRNFNYKLPEELSDRQKRATELHQVNSPHHLLYWSDIQYKSFDSNERIDANIPYMSKRGIVEMCCDFCASAAKQGDPYVQLIKEIQKGYNIAPNVIQQIVDLLDLIWEEESSAPARQALLDLAT